MRFVILVVLALAAAMPAGAVTLTVTSYLDIADSNPPDGICNASGLGCTLRAAIQTTNALAGADTILLPPGTYTLALAGSLEDLAATGDLDITGDLTIIGSGGDANGDRSATIVQAGTIAKGGIDRVFHINPFGTGAANVTIQALTVRNGSAPGSADYGYAGGISFETNGSTSSMTLYNVAVVDNKTAGQTGYAGGAGGGIDLYNFGSALAPVVIERSIISNNETTVADGGGISVYGVNLTIRDSEISGNFANWPPGTARGGGITVADGGTNVTIERSLIADNQTSSAGLGGGLSINGWSSYPTVTVRDSTFSGNWSGTHGGGIEFSGSGSVLSLTNVTLTANQADTSKVNSTGGGMRVTGGTATLTNTIVYGNTASANNEINGTVSGASSYNMVGSIGTGGLIHGSNGNRVGVNPLLGPLANNGGLTRTHKLLRGSPAIEAGTNGGVALLDQRSFDRTADSADADATATADIGAYEAIPTISDIGNQATQATVPLSVPFYVGDDAWGLAVMATSDSPAMMPNGNLVISGSGPSRTLTLTPTAAGTAIITVSVSALGHQDSDTFTLTVTAPPKDPTTTTITAPTIAYGSDATVTVNVTSAGGTPTGTVSLTVDGGSALTQTLTGGTATFTIPSLNAGSHALSASYGGATNFDTSSGTSTLTVSQAWSMFDLSAPAISYGNDATITLTSTTAGTPTGTMSTTVNGVTKVATLAGGAATFTFPGLAAGSYIVNAYYAGDTNFVGNLVTGTLVVNKATTTLSIAAPTIVYGNDATVTITVSSAAGTPDGIVSLAIDGGAPLTMPLAGGVATYTISGLAAGNHALVATYGGSANFNGSSGTATLTVNRAPTSLVISAPPAIYPADATIDVIATSLAGTPTGDVTLTVDGTPMTATLVSGIASFTLSAPAAGDHALEASYAGDPNFDASAATSTLHVFPAAVTLNASAPPIVFGSDATITVTATSAGGEPTGDITLTPLSGGTTLTQPLAGGTATFVVAGLGAGNHDFLASYAGGGNFDTATTSVTVTVTAATPSFAINAPTVFFGNDATITVTSTSSAGTPTGTISMTVNGVTQTASLAGGVATFTYSGLAAGTYAVDATYGGDANFTAGSAASTLVVNQASTTLSIAAPPIVYGNDATITVTVSSAAGTPDGTVNLRVDGGAPLTMPLANGIATYTISGLTAGDHALAVAYSGSANYTARSATGSLHVDRAATTLNVSAPAIVFGSDATITVTASSPAGVPTGSISMTVGATPMTQPLVGGIATFVVPSPAGGDHALDVSYAGDMNFAGANAMSNLHVDPATVTLTGNAPAIVYGNDATITITANSTAGTPAGDITLTPVSGAPMTAPLTGGVATFVVSSLNAGDHDFTATYAGDANFAASATTVTQHVDPATSSLTIDAPSIVYGNDATVTVTASSSAGTPAGDITLTIDGGAPLTQPLVSGVATFTIASLNAGDYALAASFAGDANISASNAASTLHVDPAATSLSIVAPSIVYGNDATITVTASSAAGAPTGDITLTIDGGGALTQPLVSGVATFTVPALGGGDHAIAATYPGDTNFVTSNATATLHVDPVATSIAIAAPSIVYGSDATITITASSAAGAPTGDVTLTVDGGTALTQPLVGGVATFTVPSLHGGDHALAATYAGNANFAASNATATLTVTRATTTISISSTSPSPSFAGDSVTIAFATNATTGDVTITSGALSCTAPASAGSCTLTFATAGTYELTATYAGDGDYAPSTSAPFTHTVEWPIGHAIVSGDTTVCAGGTATLSVDLTGTAPWTLTWSDGVVQTTSSASHQRAVRVSRTTVYTLTSVTDAHRAATIEGSATVTVRAQLDAPTITGPTSVAIGEPFELTASRGFDRYQWYLDRTAIRGATSRTLRIEAATSEDFGWYSVVGFVDDCTSSRSEEFGIIENESETLVATIVGSADGANGSRFRSAMHLFNRAGQPLSGEMSFLNAGAAKTAVNATVGLLPYETQWYADIFASAGGSGLASADLFVHEGTAPLGLIHVYNDLGENGTTGLLQPLVAASHALTTGDRAVLIAPADPIATRLNIGVRTLASGASMRVTVRSASGASRIISDRVFPPSYFTHVSAADFLGVTPEASDAIVFDIVGGSAIVYGASTDNRTNDPNIQFAQRIEAGERSRRVIPVVGSTAGAFDSRFRTSLQLHNTAAEAQTVDVNVQPHGASKSFTIEPNATLTIGDLLPAMNIEGLGTADLVASPSVIAVVRVFNDGDGQTSMTEEPVKEASVLREGMSGTILAPHAPSKSRFNIGIRTLEQGATLVVTVRSPQGIVVAQRELVLGPTHFQHTSALDATGHAFTGDESVTWEVKSGAAVIYGVWTDNLTNDPSFHYAQ